MNPQDPLADLQPLRSPELIGWWPPAPGWWVLALVMLIAIAALAYWVVRRYRKGAYRRRALQQLHSLQIEFDQPDDHREHLSHINALLKSVALVAYSRQDIAAQYGEAWRNFLNHSATGGESFQPSYAEAIYQKINPEIDIAQVHRAAHHWIKHHKVAS